MGERSNRQFQQVDSRPLQNHSREALGKDDRLIEPAYQSHERSLAKLSTSDHPVHGDASDIQASAVADKPARRTASRADAQCDKLATELS